jgi:hypothetical protein
MNIAVEVTVKAVEPELERHGCQIERSDDPPAFEILAHLDMAAIELTVIRHPAGTAEAEARLGVLQDHRRWKRDGRRSRRPNQIGAHSERFHGADRSIIK